MPRSSFVLKDSAQQVIGGLLLAGPFIVTEEVWVLAATMSSFQAAGNIVIAATIGYLGLYYADKSRDPEHEAEVVGVPNRFISLMAVSFLSVGVLIVMFGAASEFTAGFGTVAKALSITSIFSVVGAATADSLF